MDAAELFRALSDETRLRIVNLLSRCKSVSVSDLVAALEMPQWHISRHLNRLRQAGLVTARRSGTWMYYSLREEVRQVVKRVMAAVRDRLDNSIIAADLQRMREAIRRRAARQSR